MVGSALCTILGSSYVPGALALIGSPLPDVWKMTNWPDEPVGHAGGVSARARRGSRSTVAGRPVASARRPTYPVPKSIDRRASRRLIMRRSSQADRYGGRCEARGHEDRLERVRCARARLLGGREVTLQEGLRLRVAGVARRERHDDLEEVGDGGVGLRARPLLDARLLLGRRDVNHETRDPL